MMAGARIVTLARGAKEKSEFKCACDNKINVYNVAETSASLTIFKKTSSRLVCEIP